MSQVLLDDIGIRLDDHVAFEHTTWHIHGDQNWAVIGATGSGKSLLLNAICRKVPLAFGRIQYSFDQTEAANKRQYFLAREILVFSPETHRNFLRRHVSYHQARWQSIEGDDVPSVGTLLALPAEIPQGLMAHQITPVIIDDEDFRQKRDSLIKMFKLGPLLNRKILHLSHGESRKVYIARLLLQAPKLLILDDPFTGLDEETRIVLKEGIETMHHQGDPLLLTATSRIEDVCEGITHLAVVDNNQLIAQGDKISLWVDAWQITMPRALPFQPKKRPSSATFLDQMLEKYSRQLNHNGGAAKDTKGQPGSSVLVNMENINVEYGGEAVLQGVSWEVKQSERWALLGPNGAGKTTLTSLIIADNPKAYANHIMLFGVQRGSGESIWQIKQRIGWVSPELHIFYQNNVTAFEVVCSGFFSSNGLYQHCSSSQRETVHGWMDALEIKNLKDLSFQRLSTGQQRMVILVRALVSHPPLLILDEPCQGLDDLHRENIIHLLDRLCTIVPVTMIYVSHIRNEIPSTVSHLLLLNRGKIIRQGRLDEHRAGLNYFSI